MDKHFQIDIQDESNRFFKFLNEENNDRIIFSGVFGSGKTFFLNSFFEQEKDKYVKIHLFPTNYSVATTEDIFEYIKYDILYEILGRGIHLDKTDIPSSLVLTSLTGEECYSLFRDFVCSIPQIGKMIVDVVDPIQKLIKQISDLRTKLQEDEGQNLKDFANFFENKKGSLYENDFYSQLITKLIEKLRDDGKKKVVLIVDDLDRIDPEHIFRILNVLAVHFNGKRIHEYENKFSIDKIILCCDVENVKSIFSAKYGVHTDFNGYIDKFYSKEVYHFDNTEIVASIVDQTLNSIEFISESRHKSALSEPDYRELHLFLLVSMIRSNTLNLRTLMRLQGKKYSPITYSVNFATKSVPSHKLLFFEVFDFFATLLGSPENVLDRWRKTTFHNIKGLEVSTDLLVLNAYKNLMLLTKADRHNFDANRQVKTSEEVYNFSYTIREQYGYYSVQSDLPFEVGLGMFKKSLIEAYEMYKDLKSARSYRR